MLNVEHFARAWPAVLQLTRLREGSIHYNKRMPRILRTLLCVSLLALLATTTHPAGGAESRWIRMKSANFEMYSSAGARSTRDTIREFEQVRGFFLQTLGA